MPILQPEVIVNPAIITAVGPRDAFSNEPDEIVGLIGSFTVMGIHPDGYVYGTMRVKTGPFRVGIAPVLEVSLFHVKIEPLILAPTNEPEFDDFNLDDPRINDPAFDHDMEITRWQPDL